MKVRLIMRSSTADFEGKFVGYTYETYVVDIQSFEYKSEPPEIIGGEWIKNENDIPLELPY
jgi:hypothetical protein